MVEAMLPASGRTDWSDTLNLKMPTLTRQVNSLPDSIDVAREVSIEGGLL